MNKLLITAMFSFALTCMAQSAETAKYYKLDFVIKEIDGTKVLNTRAYSMTVSSSTKSGSFSSIRSGSKVPSTGADGKQQFFETGVNIDCRSVQEDGNELTMILNAEVSSTPPESTASAYPVIRQTRWASPVVVPLKRPTIVFASDDNATRHQMQLEMTASPLK